MGFTDYIKSINYLHIRKNIFRREVETAFFTHRPYKLPKINRIKKERLNEFKINYPFVFFKSTRNNIASKLLAIESEKEIIDAADNVFNNRYNIIGSGNIDLGDEINWHKDYKSCYIWENVLYWKKNFLSVPNGVDIQFPWDLARFHQGLWLGKAYLISEDEKYTTKFLELFAGFISSNPFCVGIHWLNSSEVSIRLTNILYAFAFFINSAKVDERIVNTLIEFVLYHTLYIENNLEYETYRDNRYMCNLLGLAASGLLLSDSPYGKKIFRFSADGFEEEIRKQINEEGISYEHSIPFQITVLEILYLAKFILEKGGYKTSAGFDSLLKEMFTVTASFLRDDESVPLIGDIISSRILAYKPHVNSFSFSYPMPVGSTLFEEEEWKEKGKSFAAELLFIVGENAYENFLKLPGSNEEKRSIAFIKGGHYIIRSRNLHLHVVAGEISKHGFGARGHNDTFSFDLYFNGKKFIVDSGTYSFFADSKLRYELRSEEHHNTVFIDDEPFSDFNGLFKIKGDITKPKILEWITNNEEDILSAQHYAYSRLVDPVITKRTFHFFKQKNIIKIKDEFFGGQKHKATLNLHIHPDVIITQLSDTHFNLNNNNTEIKIIINSASENFLTLIADTEYSDFYGTLRKSKKITAVIKEKFPAFIITEIQLL